MAEDGHDVPEAGAAAQGLGNHDLRGSVPESMETEVLNLRELSDPVHKPLDLDPGNRPVQGEDVFALRAFFPEAGQDLGDRPGNRDDLLFLLLCLGSGDDNPVAPDALPPEAKNLSESHPREDQKDGVPDSRMIASVSRAEAQVKALGYRLEIHGCNSPQRMDGYKVKYGSDVSFNGDGPDPYAAGIAGDNPGKRQPSVAQGTEMGIRARAWGAFAILFFAREIEMAMPPDIRRVMEAFSVIKAMASK